MPSEILSYIAGHLQPVRLGLTSYDDGRRMKRSLAACSLVCRHWSKIVRPMLFEWLQLENAADAQFLYARTDVIRS